jgi:hypothetical protein
MKYAIVIERGPDNYSAYVGMHADGFPVPQPTTHVAYVEVAA